MVPLINNIFPLTGQYFHQLSPTAQLVCLRNSISRYYHGDDAELIEEDDVDVNEVDLLLSLLKDPDTASTFVVYNTAPLMEPIDFSQLALGDREKIRDVSKLGLFEKYFGLEYYPGSPGSLGEVVHAISLTLEAVVDWEDSSFQMSPGMSALDYLMAVRYLAEKSETMLVAGAFSPISIIDWYRIQQLVFPNTCNLVFVDLVDGMKKLFAQHYGAKFVTNDILSVRSAVPIDAIFTNALTNCLVEDEYDMHGPNSDIHDMLEARFQVFKKLSELLTPGGYVFMVEHYAKGECDSELLERELLYADLIPIMVKQASFFPSRRSMQRWFDRGAYPKETTSKKDKYFVMAQKG